MNAQGDLAGKVAKATAAADQLAERQFKPSRSDKLDKKQVLFLGTMAAVGDRKLVSKHIQDVIGELEDPVAAAEAAGKARALVEVLAAGEEALVAAKELEPLVRTRATSLAEIVQELKELATRLRPTAGTRVDDIEGIAAHLSLALGSLGCQHADRQGSRQAG
ncbi:hypothetical protein HYH03_000832 [Edaphochlamys debaryana]|uniref:Uncharacterized protein n=1 Tax=Edaphochlamys debaryana TaxID=47281 RepID=A0A836C6S0_9CHLO|nr:hypothetical protein HYH03_000832 [Edaphochlamys debaryana]|eukprot:KAG2501012.1 hypothetical protein HYH03_000832 [Edaphochlamys debaryana]